jgi:hypothetical protein
MGRKEEYIQVLPSTTGWIPYLKANSNLPGPRGNLELVYAAAQTANKDQMEMMLAEDGPDTLENSPEVFVVVCGIVTLGAHYSTGNREQISILKRYADDPRWRIREAVAMALQEIGKRNMRLLLNVMHAWLNGSFCVLRAVAAGLCEPALLKDEQIATEVLDILDQITIRYQDGPGSDKEGYEILKKGLSYCWSVAAAASPDYGKILIEKWISSGHAGVRKVMLENLKKNRLVKLDKDWVDTCLIILTQ